MEEEIMPVVNGKEYPYDKEGIARAVAAAKAKKKVLPFGSGVDKKTPAAGQKSRTNPARPKKTMGY
jgi:hypothetical protein